MKPFLFFLRSLVVVALLVPVLRAHASTPALTHGLSGQTFSASGSGASVDLRNHFGLPGVTGQLVQFDTVLGKFNVEMLAGAAPISVENFLGYVNRGNYSNSIIHRSVPGFVIQGGGFYAVNTLDSVPAQAPIVLEYNLPNERGTLSMARTNTLNSATSQWFISTVDNTTTLGQGNVGGYAVFGRVLGTGMSVVDAIAAVPVYTLGSEPFTQLPLRNPQATVANLVALPAITAIATYPSGGGTSALTFSIDNSNPSVVSADLSESNLTLSPGSNAGSATITITATDTNGNTASGSFEVTVNAVVQDQTIDFPAIADRTFGDAAFTLNASASSGLGVNFSVVSGPATLSGNDLTLTGAGTVTVRASQGGDAGYHAAADVDRSFTVNKAAASVVSFGGVSATYDGTAKAVTATTSPAGLSVGITYNGSDTAPAAAGTYTLQATINDANYAGSGTGSLVIAQAAQSIAFAALADVAFGAAPLNLSATATSGLGVGFAVVSGPASLSGNTLTLTGAGAVTVRASQSGNSNYAAATAVDRTFTVGKASASVVAFTGLSATYDGTAKAVTATTSPAGLSVSITYNGGATAPTDAGTYAVVATINDANYTGSGSGALVISQAAQTITFAALSDVAFGTAPLALSATATSGLGVTFAVVSGPATLSGNTLALTGAGAVTVRATQGGNTNYEAAAAVERSFTVGANFASWLAEKFTGDELNDPLVSGPNADPDLDGFSNLVEYALGFEPKSASTANLPEVATTATDWTYTYTRPAARADLVYRVEVSTNLTTWTTANVTHELVATDANAGTQTWRASVPFASAANAFFRLQVEK